MAFFFRTILVILFSISLNIAYSQLSVTNLLEYQHGKIPGDSSSFSSIYDRITSRYTYKKLSAGIVLEQYHTGFSERNYIKPTQFFLQYNSDHFEIKAGSVYETIGRGLLLRSFEIPGAILEDVTYRSRNYFHRDILGLSSKFRYKNFSAKLVAGKPLVNVFPPSLSENIRRPEIITLLYTDYRIKRHTIGGAFMNLANSGKNELFGMLNASGNISTFLSYYVESAKNITNSPFLDFSDRSSYAFYGSINLALNSFGASLEYKNYNNFVLGAGLNEPPALVKEHTYKVLNRSTHVIQPQNETGYQVELYYTFSDLSVLTLNSTSAVNNFNKRFVFSELFAEYDFSLKERIDIKIFADYAQDPFKDESDRISTGIYMDIAAGRSKSLVANYEYQTFQRSGSRITNHVISAGFSFSPAFTLNMTVEVSDDPFTAGASGKTWLGGGAKYKVNNKHTIQLFAGNRRGGPACNAGVCYEVLDFSGAELRITSRF